MPIVNIEGVFMGAQVKSNTFEGNTKTALYVDIYQPSSDLSDKMVQLKTEDISLYQSLVDQYDMGSIFKANASVNAYQNKAYFKLLDIVSV